MLESDLGYRARTFVADRELDSDKLASAPLILTYASAVCLRIDSPLSTIRCELCINRPQMASASMFSPTMSSGTCEKRGVNCFSPTRSLRTLRKSEIRSCRHSVPSLLHTRQPADNLRMAHQPIISEPCSSISNLSSATRTKVRPATNTVTGTKAVFETTTTPNEKQQKALQLLNTMGNL